MVHPPTGSAAYVGRWVPCLRSRVWPCHGPEQKAQAINGSCQFHQCATKKPEINVQHPAHYNNELAAQTGDKAVPWLVTNLIHDFTAVTLSVKLAFFCEKRPFPCFREILWNPWFFVNFNTFTFIYEGFQSFINSLQLLCRFCCLLHVTFQHYVVGMYWLCYLLTSYLTFYLGS